MEDRKDSSALLGVEVLVGVPSSSGRTSLGLSVTNDSNSDLVRAVHDRSERNGESVSELSTLVDSTGGLGVDVRGEASRERERLDELLETASGRRVVGVEVLPSALEEEGGEDGRRTVAWTSDEEPLRLLAITLKLGEEGGRMGVDKVETGAGSPVSEETTLDVVLRQVTLKEGVGAEEDLRAGTGSQLHGI